MRTDERDGLAAAAEGTFRQVVNTVEDMHRAIARSSFRGPGAVAPKAVHDAISATVYGSVRLAGGPAVGLLAKALGTSEASLADTRGGAYALAVLNSWAGDRLASGNSALAVPMSVRCDGSEVPVSPCALAATFPEATSTVAVLLHGLGETEHAWGYQPRGGELPSYADVLAAEGVTPVLLRYNTGEHISANGRALDQLLSDLVEAWPVRVERIVLVGHSMGGLVIRSACATGHPDWVERVSDTVSLGTPHHGSAVERLANLGTSILKLSPWSRPLGKLADTRSPGIKDLRYGNLVDADWADCDPDALWVDSATDVPLLPTARHHVVAASLSADPKSLTARMVGDLLVVPASAHGRARTARRTRFALAGTEHHVPGAHHFSLLNHPAVADILAAVAG